MGKPRYHRRRICCMLGLSAKEAGIMLQVQNIEKYYGSQNQVTKALDRVSFTV